MKASQIECEFNDIENIIILETHWKIKLRHNTHMYSTIESINAGIVLIRWMNGCECLKWNIYPDAGF